AGRVAFFFSSRRRHTRFSRDWSSDVCSSDLTFTRVRANAGELEIALQRRRPGDAMIAMVEARIKIGCFVESLRELEVGERLRRRSEERRVGKECRARGSRDE